MKWVVLKNGLRKLRYTVISSGDRSDWTVKVILSVEWMLITITNALACCLVTILGGLLQERSDLEP